LLFPLLCLYPLCLGSVCPYMSWLLFQGCFCTLFVLLSSTIFHSLWRSAVIFVTWADDLRFCFCLSLQWYFITWAESFLCSLWRSAVIFYHLCRCPSFCYFVFVKICSDLLSLAQMYLVLLFVVFEDLQWHFCTCADCLLFVNFNSLYYSSLSRLSRVPAPNNVANFLYLKQSMFCHIGIMFVKLICWLFYWLNE